MESQPSKTELNARDLEQELAWFARVLDTRFKLYFDHESEHDSVFDVAPPELGDSTSPWALFLRHTELAFAERLTLVLALVPHLRPQLLDVFHTRNQKFDRPFTEFGGRRHGPAGDFLPTGETLAFLLAGNGRRRGFRLRPTGHRRGGRGVREPAHSGHRSRPDPGRDVARGLPGELPAA